MIREKNVTFVISIAFRVAIYFLEKSLRKSRRIILIHPAISLGKFVDSLDHYAETNYSKRGSIFPFLFPPRPPFLPPFSRECFPIAGPSTKQIYNSRKLLEIIHTCMRDCIPVDGRTISMTANCIC